MGLGISKKELDTILEAPEMPKELKKDLEETSKIGLSKKAISLIKRSVHKEKPEKEEKVERRLKKMEDEIVAKVRELENNKKILLQQEEKIKGKLMGLKTREDSLQRNAKIVLESKKIVEQMIVDAQKKIESWNDEWIITRKALKEDADYLMKAKKGLPSFLKDLKEQQTRDEKRRKSLEETIDTLRAERATLDKQEGTVAKNLRDVQQLRKEQQEKERDIQKREEHISKAKELKESMSRLILEHKKIKSMVEDEKHKLRKLTVESMAKMSLLKDKEIELIKRAAALQKKEDFLVQKEAELKQERRRLKEDEFKIIKGEPSPDISFEATETKQDYPKHPEVMGLLRNAKELIRQRRIDEARSQIRSIEQLQSRLKPEDTDKRRINYDLLELKTEMKLAMLQ